MGSISSACSFSYLSLLLLPQMGGPSVKMEAEFSEAEGAPLEERQEAWDQEPAPEALPRGKGALCPGGLGALGEVDWYEVQVRK